ncbi:hypothetical protein K443DRAFT_176661 [Laccaria amethystina LaAM-08-1]|uniref:Uncharacterized protein n=1 Tax=Laccaria amethystina LaAM-08-1 TaxID=1095629 RepID=A0A0C9WNN3_9AGAR|nr:hypothetical protein K443DRAFT_176661 [Laccaria amethystina LaAM-08-1]
MVIGFAPKVLLVKKGLVNGFDLSKVVHTESSCLPRRHPFVHLLRPRPHPLRPLHLHLPLGLPQLAWLFSASLLHPLARL